jgi:GAF domain/PilZ domain/Sel1 repeat
VEQDFDFTMSATLQSPRPASINRRRRVRQKAHAPAYATFPGHSKNQMLELYEVLDISEIGVAVQCPTPMEIDRQMELCLDLAEVTGQILTTARVVWSDSSGRVGMCFPRLRDADLKRLQQWLFLNAMAGAANAATSWESSSGFSRSSVFHPSYTDTLNAASAVRREAESLGSDLEAVLTLIAARSMSLLQASGAAIALAEKDSAAMTCRARAGASAPLVGAILQAGSGFSGDCVRTGKTTRCDDSETDARVNPESCRALGIRSMLASPICSGEKVIGLIEVFSAQPGVFEDNDGAVLQRLAETIVAAVNRTTLAENVSAPPPVVESFSASPGSVLFAHLPEETPGQDIEESNSLADEDKIGGIRLPRTHLYLLIAAAAAIALALGFLLAPWIQQKLQARARNGEPTVLASSRPPATSSQSNSLVDTANLDQLLRLAQQGDPAAENALGLLYAEGDEKQSVKQDEGEAAGWFTRAAEHGSVPAQYKLGLLYWGGHGVPKDPSKAYFWAVLARAGGQEGSKDLAQVLSNGMTRAQATAIEQQAEIWYQHHESHAKPTAGH